MATGIDNGSPHKGLFLDESGDRLYVTVGTAVVVFDEVSTKDGAETPDRVIDGGLTMLGDPLGIYLDPGSNTLYVTNDGPPAILIWEGASVVDGDVAPTRVLSGAMTGSTDVADVVGAGAVGD